MKSETQADRARREWGFFLGQGPGGLFVFVPAGTDPKDGRPLTHARRATPTEIELWAEGELEEIARILAVQGMPVRPPRRRKGWMSRVLGMLRGRRSDV